MREPDYDSLNLATNPYILKLLRRPGKGGSAEERVIWSSRELKVNAKGRAQLRVLVVTNLAVYNFKPGDYSKFQRRIKLDNVAAISICSESDEFVIHVPEEYDYKYKSAKRKEIAQLLQDLCKKCEKKLKVLHASGKEFEEHIVTKEDVFRLPREEILRRKKLVDFEEHDSDKEEEGGSGPAQQLLETVERLSIEDFTLLKVLGRGAFGKVMLVRKKDSGKVYAMKILKKTMVVAKKQIEHTLAERKVLEAFRHPFLMGLKFAFQTEAKLYLVLDFFKGGELFFHLRRVKKFTEEQARTFVAMIALALGHLHSLNFIYRDLKPENILMNDDGYLCLTDFGLAKQLDSEHPEAHSFVGTPEYLAPEMIQGIGHGKALDWWCVGILLYELTVGITPFYSSNVEEMYHKIVNGKLRFPPKLSESCKNLITGRNPEERLGFSRDIDEIKEHAFFDGLDWSKLLKKELPPLYSPSIGASDADVGNFSDHFLKEAVVDSVIPESQLRALEEAQSEFKQWSFEQHKLIHGDSKDHSDEE